MTCVGLWLHPPFLTSFDMWQCRLVAEGQYCGYYYNQKERITGEGRSMSRGCGAAQMWALEGKGRH